MQGEREKVAVPKPARVPKLQIVGFTEVTEPITEAITKFGGQPVWLEQPRWPLCAGNGKQIPFLGQIKLEPEIFGEIEAKMAYLFHGSDDPTGDDDSWPSDYGDSAIVLQPGNLVFAGFDQQKNVGFPAYSISASGPTTTRTLDSRVPPYYTLVEVECLAILETGTDPSYVSEETRDAWTEERSDTYRAALEGHKIGGTPNFWYNDPEFDEKSQILLLQMESIDDTKTALPFGVYYGDGGCGWWLISRDGKQVTYESMCG